MTSNKPKTAVVTGASAGIGLAIAKSLLASGYRVIANSRSLERLEAAYGKLKLEERARLHFVIGDVGVVADVNKLATEAINISGGTVDVLVNNAGSLPGMLSYGTDTWDNDVFDKWFAIFVRGPTYLLSLLVPALAKAASASGGTSSVINISSVVGTHPLGGGMGPYSMTKAALDALTKSAAADLGPKGIRVNSVSPGPVRTDILGPMRDVFEAQAPKRIALGRIGEPEEVASLVSFLANHATSSWITGAIIIQDGGMLVQSPFA